MQEKTLKVLAVDDDLINLKLLKSMLMKNEHIQTVFDASNGVDAIEILKQNSDIDLILLDIVMPIMGGIEMLKIVKADENFNQIPIIVLTTDETKKSEALESGANGFLMKPIRMQELNDHIQQLVI